jgi:TP901 family phage tail tape measure protein
MADIQSNIRIDIDTSAALANIKNLQREISAFHTAMAKGSAANAAAASNLQKDLIQSLNASGKFAASMTNVKTTTESFTNSLEKNKFSLGEYFRYAGASTKTFGKNFAAEFATINKVARERVKDLQTQYIQLGRDANGAMQSIRVRPLVLDMENLATQTAINAQKQQLFNQLLKQGSTNLLNWGKNTQWAGRQLMVGFTLPLSVFGGMAARTFMDLEKQAIQFKRVYGDLMTGEAETNAMVEEIQTLAREFTKYGVALVDTMDLAAQAAATGMTGAALTAQVTQATRLGVLGNVELGEAFKTTISITDAFGVATEDLANKIDFLNAVENQTITSIADLTIAVPKAGPVVKQLGGDVEDLAFLLTAMREGGINASEGANALKSGLASLINPTGVASDMLRGFGINIQAIVQQNKGDVVGLVTDFARALDGLDPLDRAKAIEQLFGKFQFSRLSTLFQNVIRDGNQASRVLELTNATVEELAQLSSRELGKIEDSSTFKFQKAIEDLKAAVAPVGEEFLKAITPVIEFGTKLLEEFNKLDNGVKGFITGAVLLFAGLGPVVLMVVGLLANGVANLIKGVGMIGQVFQKLRGQATGVGAETSYMTQEQIRSLSVAASLDQVHSKLKQTFTSEAAAVDMLTAAYTRSLNAQRAFSVPGGVARGTTQTQKYANGVVSVPGPKGAGDIVPAMLSPGEAVIPAKHAKKYAPLIQGMIAGDLPGYAKGVFLGMPQSAKSVSKNRTAADEIYEMFKQSSYANVPPTIYGHQISKTTGHSFPIFGLGGVYQKGGKQVFVKPVLDEKAALAEMRSTEISRKAHGLEAPQQRIVVIKDPMDVKGVRRFLALESDLDPKFVNTQPMGLFNEEQYFRQLVASLLRVDKDLSGSNVYGNVVADAGPAGVFNKASGLRNYDKNLPSMEEQAIINLLGIRGGAKRAFAESTLGLMAGLTPAQYHQKMIAEITKVLPKLKQTVASFGLTNPTEVGIYDDMIRRLESGLGVNWSKFHAIHSNVKIAKPKTPKAVPGFSKGTPMVPGTGKGDKVAAFLEPGEAVIPAAVAKKNRGFIAAMIEGSIPGFVRGSVNVPQQIRGTTTIPAASYPMDTAQQQTAVKLRGYAEAFRQSVDNGEDIIEEVFARLADRTGVTLQNFKAELEVVATEFGGMRIGEATQIATGKELERKASIVKGGNVRSNLVDTKGDLGLEEFDRAKASADAGKAAMLEYYQSVGYTAKDVAGKITQAGELHRAHIAEVDGVGKQFEEGWNEDLWVAQASFENQLSNAIKSSGPITNLYTDKLNNLSEEQASEEQKREILRKINANLALTEDELQIQAQVLRNILNDTEAIAQLPGKPKDRENLVASMTANVAGAEARADLGPASQGVGSRTPQQISAAQAGLTAAMTRGNAEADGRATPVPVTDAGRRIVERVNRQLADSVNDASGASSPSREMDQSSENLVSGAKQGLESGKDDMFSAGQQLAASADAGATSRTTGTRTMGPVPAVAFSNQTESQKATKATGPVPIAHPALVALGVSSQNASKANQENAERSSKLGRAFENTGNTLTSLSIGIASVSGILSMFGGQFGELSGVISMISAGLFGLIQIVQAVTQMKLQELIVGRKAIAMKAIEAAKSVGGAAAAGGLAGTLTIARIAMTAFLGPVGLVVLAVTALATIVGFTIAAKIKEKESIEAMGNAAFVTADQLKKLGEIYGFTAQTGTLDTAFQGGGTTSLEAEKVAAERSADEQFLEEYAADIEALKGAGNEQAQIILQSIAEGVSAGGAPQAVVEGIVKALADAAGKKDLDLSFSSIDVKTDPSQVGSALQQAMGALEQNPVSQQPGGGGTVVRGRGGQYVSAGAAPTAETSLVAGAMAGTLTSMNTMLVNGQMEATEFNAEMALLSQSFSSLDEKTAAIVLPDLAEQLGATELLSGITNTTDAFLILQAAATGLSADEVANYANALKEAEEAAKDGTPDEGKTKKAEDAREALNNVVETGAAATIELTAAQKAQAEQEAAIAEGQQASLAMQEQIDKVKEQDAAYQELIARGYSAAEAVKMVSDANFLAAFSAETNAAGQQAVIDKYKELQGLIASSPFQAASKTFSGGGGAPKKTPLQEAIEDLEEQQKQIKQASSAYNKLRDAGLSIGEAFTAAKDPILAAAVATTQVGTQKWRELLELIKAVDAAAKNLSNKDAFIETKNLNDIQADFAKIIPQLSAMGLSLESIETILSNPDMAEALAADLADGALSAGWIAKYLNELRRSQAIELQIKLATPEGMEEVASEGVSNALAGLDALEAQVQLDFQMGTNLSGQNEGLINTAVLEKAIADAQEVIAQKQFELDDYEASLQGIADQEEEINEVYDERLKSLEKANEANGEMAARQESQLTVAEALSRGDIAAAAKAAQELRAKEAQQRLEAQRRAIEASRERALGAVRSADGKTRAEIEKEIKRIKDEIFDIEEKTLEPAQRALENANYLQQSIIQSLTFLGQTRAQWEANQNAIDLARVKADAYKQSIVDAIALIPQLAAAWANVNSNPVSLTGPASQPVNDPPPPAPRPTGPAAPAVTNDDTPAIQGARVRKALNTPAVAPKVSKALREVAGITTSNNDRAETLIAAFMAKITKAQANAIFTKAGVTGYALGGKVPGYMKSGGFATKLFSMFASGTDTVPAMLTPGEFVVKKPSVERFGLRNLQEINRTGSLAGSGSSVYNYSVNVMVKSDANPDEIARAVRKQINGLNDQTIRSNRF